MAKKAIRVPRTTALFVTGLARIIREHFGLKVLEHEHWTFEQVADWEQCGSPGHCPVHGFSRRYLKKIEAREEREDWLGANILRTGMACYPYDVKAYVGIGQVWTGIGDVKLRVVIEETDSEVMGHMYDVRIWACTADGKVQCGAYYLCDDGTPMACDRPISAYPPNRLSFRGEREEASSA